MKYIKKIYEFLVAADPTTKPLTPVKPATPQAPPRPGRPGPTVRPGERERERPMAAEPTTKPLTPVKPATPQAPPRPGRPGPTVRPGEREREKPMAALNQVIDMFFQELSKEKDTPAGKRMIKKLHSK